MPLSLQTTSSPRAARTRDGANYRIRPITPEDADRERAFLDELGPAARYGRFLHAVPTSSRALADPPAHCDDKHTIAGFAAVIGSGADERIVGVARYAVDPTGLDCEFAVSVAEEWQRRGIGTRLARALFEHGRVHGLRRLYGTVLANNDRMLRLTDLLGMKSTPGNITRTVYLDLASEQMRSS
jgi:acetyltransferase